MVTVTSFALCSIHLAGCACTPTDTSLLHEANAHRHAVCVTTRTQTTNVNIAQSCSVFRWTQSTRANAAGREACTEPCTSGASCPRTMCASTCALQRTQERRHQSRRSQPLAPWHTHKRRRSKRAHLHLRGYAVLLVRLCISPTRRRLSTLSVLANHCWTTIARLCATVAQGTSYLQTSHR